MDNKQAQNYTCSDCVNFSSGCCAMCSSEVIISSDEKPCYAFEFDNDKFEREFKI